MTIFHLVSIAVFVGASMTPVRAAEEPSPGPSVQDRASAPLAPSTRVTASAAGVGSLIVLEAWGRLIARETDAAQFGLTDPERRALIRGLMAGAGKQPPPQKLDRIYADVVRLVDAHRAAVREVRRRENLAAAPSYFATLRRQPGVEVRPSGLFYEILRPGSGPKPTPRQTAVVTYHARLIDGTEFDSTDQAGPVEVVLGKIVPGWREGLQLIGVGGRIRLHLPAALGFDDEDALKLGIPPASIVVSDLELLAIKDGPPEEPAPPSAPMPPPPPPGGFGDEEILETWGWILAQERGVMQAGLDEAQQAALARGLGAALAGEAAAFDENVVRPFVDRFVAGRRQVFEERVRQARREETAAFFEKIASKPGVVCLPDGLCYEIVRPGSGAAPRPDQRVRVDYVGRLIDGTVFDRSDPELGPLDVDLARVIPGWTEGMQKIGAGGVIRLYIPPGLAYGDMATGGIPPESALSFEIELLDVRDVPAEEVQAAGSPPPTLAPDAQELAGGAKSGAASFRSSARRWGVRSK